MRDVPAKAERIYIDMSDDELSHQICMGIRHGLFGVDASDRSDIRDRNEPSHMVMCMNDEHVFKLIGADGDMVRFYCVHCLKLVAKKESYEDR